MTFFNCKWSEIIRWMVPWLIPFSSSSSLTVKQGSSLIRSWICWIFSVVVSVIGLPVLSSSLTSSRSSRNHFDYRWTARRGGASSPNTVLYCLRFFPSDFLLCSLSFIYPFNFFDIYFHLYMWNTRALFVFFSSHS